MVKTKLLNICDIVLSKICLGTAINQKCKKDLSWMDGWMDDGWMEVKAI